jgi:heparan-alpha-glucosaminide N-acetyltransferase
MSIGGALCSVQQYDGAIPICKNLWTLSFVCLMGGWGFLILIGLYYIIDVLKLWDGAPFFFVGMNSILVYLLHEILEGTVFIIKNMYCRLRENHR